MSSLGSTFITIQQNITRYVYSSCLVFDTICCILNITLLSRRQFCTISFCLWKFTQNFNVGSIGMLIALLLDILPYIYIHSIIILTNTTFCKIRVYIIHSTTVVFRWLLAAAS
ncbi:unnamed protein product, partial [Adineta ricciae]